jgi:hypothetical protein
MIQILAFLNEEFKRNLKDNDNLRNELDISYRPI